MKEVLIINQHPGGIWFEEQVNNWARNFWGRVAEDFDAKATHYLGHLVSGRHHLPTEFETFIPFRGIIAAGDKRIQAVAFKRHNIPTPRTHLLQTADEVIAYLAESRDQEWILKFPTGMATRGHRIVTEDDMRKLTQEDFFTRVHWPKPLLLQQFIRKEDPDVYRAYCVDSNVFAWNVRRFPPGVQRKPLVAHAVGARYYQLDNPPPENVQVVAGRALQSVGLFTSFGVVDLIHSSCGGWLVLEVGTDGIDTIVDRDFDDPALDYELNSRIAEAIWKTYPKPWGEHWTPRAR